MKTYLLVFDREDTISVSLPVLGRFVDMETEIYAFDENICFIKTNKSMSELAEQLQNEALSGKQFFLTEVASDAHAGALLPSLWHFLRSPSFSSAA